MFVQTGCVLLSGVPSWNTKGPGMMDELPGMPKPRILDTEWCPQCLFTLEYVRRDSLGMHKGSGND